MHTETLSYPNSTYRFKTANSNSTLDSPLMEDTNISVQGDKVDEALVLDEIEVRKLSVNSL